MSSRKDRKHRKYEQARHKHEKGVAYVTALINQMFHPEPGTPTMPPPNVWAMGAEIKKVTGK